SDSYSLDVDYRSIPVHESYQRAKEYARKALSLDESVPTAHASLAWAVFIYDWHWEESEREFRRAIELNPRYASAHQWFAFLLAARGQLDAALLEAHTALELDPASVSIRRAEGRLRGRLRDSAHRAGQPELGARLGGAGVRRAARLARVRERESDL